MFKSYINAIEGLKALYENFTFRRIVIKKEDFMPNENNIKNNVYFPDFILDTDSSNLENKLEKGIFNQKLEAIIDAWKQNGGSEIYFDLNTKDKKDKGDFGDDHDRDHHHDDHDHTNCDHEHGHCVHGLPLPESSSIEVEDAGISYSEGDLAGFANVDTTQAFALHSNPNADHKIYLDFDGHTTSGTIWNSNFNGGKNIETPAFNLEGNGSSFTNNELQKIVEIWKRVAEDFAPFDVDVTTEAPPVDQLIKSGKTDKKWGIRVSIGGDGSWYKDGVGGTAYLNSFNYNSDTPTFVFSSNFGSSAKNLAEAISHEVGHTLGLSHDGKGSSSYYSGQGSGETGWAPLMGVGYSKAVTQWSKGDYTGATNSEDDLKIISDGRNGFTYRVDDHGNAFNTATSLTNTNGTITAFGIIERNTDKDFFSFNVGEGLLSLNINPASIGANLDIKAQLFDFNWKTIATSNDSTTLSAKFTDINLTAGKYFLSVEGTGSANYSDYGSLGQYSIFGNVAVSDNDFSPSNTAPIITSVAAITVAENQTNAIDIKTTDDNDSEGSGLSYSFTGGADSSLFNLNPNTGVVTFKAAPDFENPSDANSDNDYQIQVTVSDAGGLTDVQDITITVSDENENTGNSNFSNNGNSDFYFSLNRNNANIIPGTIVTDEDIVYFDGNNFSIYFDGSDVGVAAEDISALDIISQTEILISFTGGGTVNGISFDDSDILKFTATSLGTNTSGIFEMYFDGSQVGLTSSGEDIDALTLLDNGDLLISTTGSVGVTGVSGADEDILLFKPTSLGNNTSGTWSLYFDGSDVDLSNSSTEDVNALALDNNNQFYLSTIGDVAAGAVSGTEKDVIVFNPTSLGSNTNGNYDPNLFFDGSSYPFDIGDDIYGIDLNIGPSAVPNL